MGFYSVVGAETRVSPAQFAAMLRLVAPIPLHHDKVWHAGKLIDMTERVAEHHPAQLGNLPLGDRSVLVTSTNADLFDRFLALLQRVAAPEDRLRVIGEWSVLLSKPQAAQMLARITIAPRCSSASRTFLNTIRRRRSR
jgi:hypothetical protein